MDILDATKTDEAEKTLHQLCKTISQAKADQKQHRQDLDMDLAGIAKAEKDASALHVERNVIDNRRVEIDEALKTVELDHEERKLLDDEKAKLASRRKEINRDLASIEAERKDLEAKAALHREELKKARADQERGMAAAADCIRSLLSEYDAADQKVYALLTGENGAQQDGDTAKAQAHHAGGIRFSTTALEAPKRLAQLDRISIDSTELEYRIEGLLDHLTARRIAEEMDTPTYLFRLDQFMDRAASRADTLRTDLGILDNGLDEFGKAADAFNAKILDLIARCPIALDEAAAEALRTQSEDRRTRFKSEIQRFRQAVKAINRRLEGFISEVCGKDNKNRLSDIARRISKDIEGGLFLKLWSAFVVLAATIAAKLALTEHTSFILPHQITAVLAFVAGTTYIATTYFRARYRTRVMEIARDGQRKLIGNLLSPEDKAVRENKTFFQFRAFAWNGPGPDVSTMRAPASRSYIDQRVIHWGKDAGVILAPYVLLTLSLGQLQSPSRHFTAVLYPGPDAEDALRLVDSGGSVRDLFGQDASGQPCLLASGRIVRGDVDYYYVLNDAEDHIGAAILPENYSHMVSRAAVRQISVGRPIMGGDPIVRHCADYARSEPAAPITSVVVDVPNAGGTPECATGSDCSMTGFAGALDGLNASIGTLSARLDVLSDTAVTSVAMLVLPDPGVPTRSPWITSNFIFDGSTPVATKPNTLLLPYFARKTCGTDSKASGAFRKGRETFAPAADAAGTASQDCRLDDASREMVETYIAKLADVLKASLEDGDRAIGIVVKGFASDDWQGVTDEAEKRNLNHALSEGRSVALLERLQPLTASVNDRITIENAAGESMGCLATWSVPAWQDRQRRVHADPDAWERDRAAFFGDDVTVTKPLETFLHRSVVIEFRKSGPCVDGPVATADQKG